MKRLSYYAPALALAAVLALSGAAFAPTPAAKSVAATSATSDKASKQVMYYWYSEPDDTYNDYTTVSQEIYEWWVLLGGVSINQNGAGGTLIVCGYLSNSYPHIMYPSVYLYAHYVY
jgi:hypothetical protein